MKIEQKTIENDLEYLRQVSKEVDFKDSSYLEDIENLEKFCVDSHCLALAAVQIGIPKRIMYIRNTNLDDLTNHDTNEKKILINPEIISQKGLTRYWEACYSCLNNTGLVERPYEIEVRYYDIEGRECFKKFEGFEATVFCHEFDHLNGILHIDLALEILNMSQEERREFRESHPYEIISKDCDYPLG